MKLLSASSPLLTLRTVIFILLFIGLTQSLPDNVGDGSSFQIKYVWALITAFHLSFTFGFAMGSNEVSNAFATSVGSGAIKLRTAYILATIIESAGAILLGYKVLQTLRFEVIDLEMYAEAPHELLLGQIAILGGIGLDTTPFWLALLISLAPRLTPANGAFTSLETSFAHNAVTVGDPDLGLRRFWFLPNRTRRDDPKTLRLFSAIQVFTGCFTGFSHGSKDIPNTIAPLATLIAVFSTAKVPSPGETPLWILCYGSFAACIGFWMLGHRVIKTVGKEFTEINSFCGFTVELGAAITVLCAAKTTLGEFMDKVADEICWQK
uniref:Phosphate transporter n=1 Tax=Meloidogyne javanica TaxID=6303 RepID=A0A915N516_MELJA